MSYDYNKLAATAKKMQVYLKDKGATATVKTSRYQTQIKALEIAWPKDLKSFFTANGVKAEVGDLSSVEEKAISGKYKAKIATLTAAVAGAAKGEKFFIVNTYTEKGSLKTKDLAPEKFKLTSKPYKSANEFDKAVHKGVNENTIIPEEIKTVLKELYDTVAANTTTRDSIPMTVKAKKAFSIVKSADKQAIGKDFGEILSMRWYITQSFAKGWTECLFSTISNEALVDFTVRVKVGNKVVDKNVSAKFEAGAAPSIGAIVGNIDKVYKTPNKNEKMAIDVLKSLSEGTDNTSAKILAAMKSVNHPAYIELKKIIGKSSFTTLDISKHIEGLAKTGKTSKARIDLFNTAYKQFYAVLGKNASADSVAVVFQGVSYKKYYSLVMAPMGYGLVDYMNKQSVYQEILNNISQQMKTEQVYLNFTGDNLAWEKKLFSKAQFKFAYGANAKDSDNTGIKFSMK